MTGAATNEPVKVSVVIPLGDKVTELGEVLELYQRELDSRHVSSEFIVVLDGVSDDVFKAARAARPEGANVRLVRLNHPFGESIAFSAGFRITGGEIIITLPPYLQIEPADIHRVLDGIDEGLDVVAGWRFKRVDPVLNRIQSLFFNTIMRVLTGVRLHDMNCPVRAVRRKVLEDVTIQGDLVRFLPIMAHRHGFRVGEAKVRHLRERGKSGFFGVGVYVRRFLDVINLLFLSKFTRAPLRFFGVGGFIAFLAGFVICAWLTIDYLFAGGEPLRNRATLVAGVMLIMLGVQIFAIGLVGEMIIYLQAKNLKEYRTYDETELEERRARGKRGRKSRGGDGGGRDRGDDDPTEDVRKVGQKVER